MVALKHLVFIVLPLFTASALLSGCNKDASKSSGSSGGASTDQRASIAALKRSLDEVDDRIKVLEEKAAQAGTKVKQGTKEEIAKLQAARDKLYVQLQGMQTAGVEGWEELKDKTAASVDSLGHMVVKTWKTVTAEERSASSDGGDR